MLLIIFQLPNVEFRYDTPEIRNIVNNRIVFNLSGLIVNIRCAIKTLLLDYML